MKQIEILKKALEKIKGNKDTEIDRVLEWGISTYLDKEFQVKEELNKIVQGIKLEIPKTEVTVSVPPIKVPQTIVNFDTSKIKLPEFPPFAPWPKIEIPKAEVSVNVPDIKIPDVQVNIPDKMTVEGDVRIIDNDYKRPLAVRLVDLNNKPYEAVGGGVGFSGRSDFFTIKDIQTSSGASVVDNDGFVKVTGSLSSTPFATYYSSDAVGSVNFIQYGGSDVSKGTELGDGVQRVFHVSDVGISTRVNAFDTSIETKQVSGAIDSVNVIGTVPISLADTIDVRQVSGVSWSTDVLSLPAVVVTSITNTIAANVVDSSGIGYSGSNPFAVQNKELPDATSTFSPTNATSSAYENKRTAKASAGTLYSVNGYNSSTSAQFIQIHNTTGDPGEAAVPVVVFTVPASGNFSYSADKFGRFFSAGITVCNSSTGPTRTLQAADCWFDIQYI